MRYAYAVTQAETFSAVMRDAQAPPMSLRLWGFPRTIKRHFGSLSARDMNNTVSHYTVVE